MANEKKLNDLRTLLKEYLRLQAELEVVTADRNVNLPSSTCDVNGYRRFDKWRKRFDPLHQKLYHEMPHKIIDAALLAMEFELPVYK